VGSITVILQHTKDTANDIHYVAKELMIDDREIISFSDQAKAFMNENHIWAMFLNNQGNVIAQHQLPAHLNKNYTISDVAKFSRWYLDKYPVLVQVTDSGLLVLGYSSADMLGVTITKLYYVTDNGFVTAITGAVISLFIVNIIALIFLFWKNSKRVEHEVESEFKKKDEARAQWINGVTHDIRTPLSVIMGYAAQIEDASDLDNERKRQGAIMRKQGERVRDLIIDLNLVSKLEYAMQPLKMELLNPAELICETIIDFIENSDHPYEIEPDIPEHFSAGIQGDKALLKRMLLNLLNNSVKHNNDDVKIKVSLRQYENMIYIEIEDNGIGMDSGKMQALNNLHLPDAYDIYKENGDSAHGVGLRLVIDTVVAHNGVIHFESVNPHGLKVVISFTL